MKKTLIITLDYLPQIGGIASYVENFVQHVPSEQIVLYAPKAKGDVEIDVKNSFKTYRYTPYFAFFWPQWLRMIWQIRKIVKKEQIEAIHVHQVLPVGYVAMVIKKLYKIPFTIFLHGTDLVRGSKKMKKLKRVCDEAETLVVNSEFLQSKLVSIIPTINQTKIRIVYPCPSDFFVENPFTEEDVSKLKAELALTGKRVIITVARLADGKGYPILISFLPKILQKIPNLAWIIVGDGPKREEIIKLIQKNGLQNIIRFLGSVPHAELPKLYRLADVFVMLTHKDEAAEEGWGTVFLEAAASGLPVVAGRAGGVSEAVKDLETGLMVDTYNENNVVSTIIELLEDREYARELGEAGRARVIKEFNWDEQIKKITM